MLNSADFYTLTDTLRIARASSGRPKVIAGLGIAPRPGRMQHRVSGKEIVDELPWDYRSARQSRFRMLNLKGNALKMDAAEIL